jgi:(1->4)-alpha-D-glucan 1-alpha-D-glucosylmutase
MDDAALDAFRERIQAYMLKAAREAKVHTSWVNPYAPYEAALARFVEGLLGRLDGNRFLQDFVPLARRVAHHGCVNSLAQTLVKLTSPGVPDFYQGTELWQLALVDPDNRRPVDYAVRERLLGALADATDPAALLAAWPDGRVKLWLIARVLALRRERADWFRGAGYLRVAVQGAHATRICAYARTGDGTRLVTVIPRLWSALVRDEGQWPLGERWAETHLVLPGKPTAWRNVLTGARLAGDAGASATRLALAEVLATFPVALLEPSSS